MSEVMTTRLWPVTIMSTRYGGAYAGGPWAAFHLDSAAIPSAATADDITCSSWWNYFGGGVGVGKSPDEALRDLEGLERRLQYDDLTRFMRKWSNQEGFGKFEDEDDDD